MYIIIIIFFRLRLLMKGRFWIFDSFLKDVYNKEEYSLVLNVLEKDLV